MSRDVFISYKTEDKEFAERLCAALEREDISCWLAPRDIPPGREWAVAIVDGLQRSKNFVLLLSAHSVAAKQIAREAELADKQNLPIFTFRIEDIQPPKELLYFLGNVQWLDGFGEKFESAVASLAEVIRSGSSFPAPKTTIRHAPSPTNPPSTPPTTPPPTTPLPVVAAAPIASKKTYLLPIVAGVVVLIGLGLWIGLRGASPSASDGTPAPLGQEVDTTQEAKAEADRFLKERDSGKYEEAWNEYTAGFRNKNDEAAWQSEAAKRNSEHGGVEDHEFRNCRSSKPDIYTCEYTLKFKDGSRFKNDLRVEKNTAGGWSIDNGKVIQEQ